MTVWEEIQNTEGWFYEEENDGRVYQCVQCGDESYERFQFIFIPLSGWLCEHCHHEQDV